MDLIKKTYDIEKIEKKSENHYSFVLYGQRVDFSIDHTLTEKANVLLDNVVVIRIFDQDGLSYLLNTIFDYDGQTYNLEVVMREKKESSIEINLATDSRKRKALTEELKAVVLNLITISEPIYRLRRLTGRLTIKYTGLLTNV